MPGISELATYSGDLGDITKKAPFLVITVLASLSMATFSNMD